MSSPVIPVETSGPRPGGHYSHIIKAGNLYFISGQLPITADGKPAESASPEEQAELCLKNMKRLIDDAGLGLENVAKTTVYISDVELWPRVNAVYAKFFGDHRPARAIVPVKKLHFGLDVEIEAILVE